MKSVILIVTSLLLLPSLAHADAGLNAPLGKHRTELSEAQESSYREKSEAARKWRQKISGESLAEEDTTPITQNLAQNL